MLGSKEGVDDGTCFMNSIKFHSFLFFQLFLFGCIPEYLMFYNTVWLDITYFMFGLAQGLPKPVSVRVLAEWFPRVHYGKVIEMYSLSYCIGRTAGSYMSSSVIDYGYEVLLGLYCNAWCITPIFGCKCKMNNF